MKRERCKECGRVMNGNKVINQKKERLAVELYEGGMTFADIGTTLGISTSSAWRIVRGAKRDDGT